MLDVLKSQDMRNFCKSIDKISRNMRFGKSSSKDLKNGCYFLFTLLSVMEFD